MKTYAVREHAHDDLTSHLLFHRGIKTQESADSFLNPNYDTHTHDPFLFKNMDKAVERILRAFRENEQTVIYSDYDTDGIPGAVALHDFFKKAGFENFINYIPHRHDEGFGVNSDAVEQFIKDEVKLLITIDCGTGDIKPVSEAKAGGIDVIITDHHLAHGTLPPAYAIINPKQDDCTYPEKMLCGSGVIFKLIQAIIKKGNETGAFKHLADGEIKAGWEKWLLDMVGIATLSDMVPLTGENRVFAYYGLTVLRKSPRLGLMRLLRELAVDQRYLTEDDIGFTIGPRINAASRMGVPMDAFHLLSTKDPVQAEHFAKHLNEINLERKGTVAALVKEIKKIIKERWGSAETANKKNAQHETMPPVIVIGNPDWRPALLGLAANTFAEEYNRPAFFWGRDGDGVIKGSCRSDGETDLVALMQTVEADSPKTFIQFGGHAFSGGFAVETEKIHDLGEKLSAAFIKNKADRAKKPPEPTFIDKEMMLADVTWGMYQKIERLAPFGIANSKPLFMFRTVVPDSVRQFGKEKNHLEIIFKKGSALPGGVKAIGFFMTAGDWQESLGEEIEPGKAYTLVAHFEKSIFRGKTELRLRIVDIIK